MTDDQASRRPLGWWLKEADARLESAFDRRLQGEGVDRRGWQVLASLSQQPLRRTHLVGSLARFEAPTAVHAVIDGLAARGWIEEAGDELALTPAGAARHAELAPLVAEIRAQIRAAVPEDDYVALVRLLERVVRAL